MTERFIGCLCGNDKEEGKYCKFTQCKKYMKKENEVISAMVLKSDGIRDGCGAVTVRRPIYAVVEKKGKVQPFQEGVDLLHIGKKWYLQYSLTRCTGGFKSKRKAIEWWVRGGR